ncbi:unnamed protein product [Mycena citricolor]|uniref:Uncharacterized protein n=1 Tax=Mycena citricolor TaxID=2018698 RepID=A0AAD2JX27_9AGAR|nr:unnamed protein product [Mycena citricolor]
MRRSGIVHTGSLDGSQEPKYLDLEEVRAKVNIIDVTAQVILTQAFRNTSAHATGRAKYCFPVPAGAALCAFELRTEDGAVVKAVCKEKTQARLEFELALEEGRETGLLDWVTDDIFTISIGSVAAGARVTTKVVYTMTLMNDDYADEIRFQMPMCVGERYGPPPSALEGASDPSSSTRIRITAHIQTSGTIDHITSPSHPNEITQSRYETGLGRASRRRVTVNYRSKNFLECDFVLVVRAEGLDEPRCFAELYRDPKGRHSDTLALQFTVVLNKKLPSVSRQEFVFVVDRSGSMGGARIETAKSTLGLLLRMLPNENTSFNVFSFGSKYSSLWSNSQPYNASTLQNASLHVDAMSADMGGTEIGSTLNATFSARDNSRATAVFLLTDGESNGREVIIADIRRAVQASHAGGSRHHLRVFCLGIGDGISTDTCEGIARAGNGVCLFAVHTEDIVGRCARLFRAGRKSIVKDIAIDWGVPLERLRSPVVNFTTPDGSTKAQLRPAPAVQQSPKDIPSFHAGVRMCVYAILTLRTSMVPKEITLTGRLDDGTAFELSKVQIRGVNLKDGERGHPAIHSLAAWRLIQDQQDSAAPLAAVWGDAPDHEIRKASIIRLGARYQIATQHTSFIAVNIAPPPSPKRARSPMPPRDPSPPRDSPIGPVGAVVRRLLGTFWTAPSSQDNEEPGPEPEVPGAWHDDPQPDTSRDNDGDDGDTDSVRTFTTISSLDPSPRSSLWTNWTDDPQQPMSEEDAIMQRCPSPKLESLRLAPPHIQRRTQPATHVQTGALPPPPPPRATAVPAQVVQLVRLQNFDGSFSEDSARAVVGSQALQRPAGFGVLVTDQVWASAVCIAFMMDNLPGADQKELLDELVEKTHQFLMGRLGTESQVKALVKKARQELAK